MRFNGWHWFRSLLILVTFLGTTTMFGQGRYPFVTPSIDSICQSTLEYIRLKQLLIQQREQIGREVQQIERTMGLLRQEQSEILSEKKVVESELAAIIRHLDSLTPKRPEGPRPKENIIDILNERLSFHGSYGININQLALSNWAAGGENTWTG